MCYIWDSDTETPKIPHMHALTNASHGFRVYLQRHHVVLASALVRTRVPDLPVAVVTMPGHIDLEARARCAGSPNMTCRHSSKASRKCARYLSIRFCRSCIAPPYDRHNPGAANDT